MTDPARTQLAIFSERAKQIVRRVSDKQMAFTEAVDFLYSAADIAGLVETYGDDKIQAILADAFMRRSK